MDKIKNNGYKLLENPIHKTNKITIENIDPKLLKKLKENCRIRKIIY